MLTFILLRNKCRQIKPKNMTSLCEVLRSIQLGYGVFMDTSSTYPWGTQRAINRLNSSFLFSIYLSIELSSKSSGVLVGKWVTLEILFGSKEMEDKESASELVIFPIFGKRK